MPATDVVYYQEIDRSVPVLEWLRELAKRDRRAAEKCLARIEVLREMGHELRRPIADYLRDGIYELRVRAGRSQHRILYFFHGRVTVVLAHGLTKEREVRPMEIERALVRKRSFEKSPNAHTYREETSNG
jgi:hypothetical protein